MLFAQIINYGVFDLIKPEISSTISFLSLLICVNEIYTVEKNVEINFKSFNNKYAATKKTLYFNICIISLQKIIIDSMVAEGEESLKDKAYYGIAIVYFFFAIFNWSAPSVISLIGPKFSMIFGGAAYL